MADITPSQISPQRESVSFDAQTKDPTSEGAFWFSLIPEDEAARFLGLSVHTLRAYRSRGGGPRYVAVSSRCLRYRRIDCRVWSEERLRTSTSDAGLEVAAP